MLTDNYSEAEIQALIALAEIASPFNNPNDAPHVRAPKNITEAQTYFRRFALASEKTADMMDLLKEADQKIA